MKLFVGHIECKWTHNDRLELIYYRQKYGDELFRAINTAGEITQRRYNSPTLPQDMYKRVDFFLTPDSSKAATMFMLRWAEQLEKEDWAHLK